ncbi:GPP34 family phosphoprotein [Nocardia exalbida]|uniref:GPP34 family phosphoprotein n=1 Tax=Nocardia exalbida TaxID=290231 RepID=UPI0005936AA9|nr:GPP34 family phosphoprotein [Nocardia exalbida]
MTTLGEDLLWLLLDDNTGALLIDRPQLSHVLGAAVYLETSGPAVVSKTSGSTRPPRIPRSTRAQRKMLLAGLVAEGRVCQMPTHRWAVPQAWRWPTLDVPGKTALRQALQRTLFDAHPPTPRHAALIALLRAVDTLEQQCPGWHRSEIRRAATAIETYPECHAAAHTLRHANQDAYATSFSGGIRPWLP